MKNIFSTTISKQQAKDTGMAVVLILLLITVIRQDSGTLKLAIIALILAMTVPIVYKYPALIWLGLSQIFGTAVSRILLTLIFFMFVVPVGFFRRLLGYDSLKLRKFKRGTESVMQVREITFSKDDIERPF